MSQPAPALKDQFDAALFRHVSTALAAIEPRFSAKIFRQRGLEGLDALNLLQRLRRLTDAVHAALPLAYPQVLAALRQLAPQLPRGLPSLMPPDYVSVHGRAHFDESMEALKFFTPFGSSEFGVRPFLAQDLSRALRWMEKWSRDSCEHVRRLASEGCRPRLPWAARLPELIRDPHPVAPILENLRADPSAYVRKSVANHLNDIAKDHPEWVLERLAHWPRDHPATAWISRHALRTLIKQGDRRALALLGAGEPPQLTVTGFSAKPTRLRLGQRFTLEAQLRADAHQEQRLVIDYAIHYVKKSARPSRKVFKWKEITLAPGEHVILRKDQTIRDFTTRTHHPGRHDIELLVNGETLAKTHFDLVQAE